MHKTDVFPVRCRDINLEEVLVDFPAKIASFPGKYSGHRLHFRRLRKVDLQPLINKITGKLSGWIGKNLALPGRVTLAKMVLLATGIYHATAIPLSKCAQDKINKIARNFVWAGDKGEHASQHYKKMRRTQSASHSSWVHPSGFFFGGVAFCGFMKGTLHD
jgi:hypothetical protein